MEKILFVIPKYPFHVGDLVTHSGYTNGVITKVDLYGFSVQWEWVTNIETFSWDWGDGGEFKSSITKLIEPNDILRNIL